MSHLAESGSAIPPSFKRVQTGLTKRANDFNAPFDFHSGQSKTVFGVTPLWKNDNTQGHNQTRVRDQKHPKKLIGIKRKMFEQVSQ